MAILKAPALMKDAPQINDDRMTVRFVKQAGIKRFTVRRRLSIGGDVPLLRIAVDCVESSWPAKLNQESQWPEILLTSDNAGGSSVDYKARGISFESWTLRPTPDGKGFEEYLVFVASKVNRRIAGGTALDI